MLTPTNPPITELPNYTPLVCFATEWLHFTTGPNDTWQARLNTISPTAGFFSAQANNTLAMIQ